MDDKFWMNFHKLMGEQNFKNEDEMKAFLETLMNKPIPEALIENMTDGELARSIIFEAKGFPVKKKQEAIEQSLLLDPECIDAYELLGDDHEMPEIAICFYKRGVDIGKKIFGGDYLQTNKGMFWGMHETRPFMRCMYSYADCLYNIGSTEEAIAVFEEMLELNPNDNQGIRDQLMLYLIETDEFDKYQKYAKMYKDDRLSFALFNKALFTFKVEGENDNSNAALKEAMKQNKFVAAKLTSKTTIDSAPGYYGLGDNNEALYYAMFAQSVWQETDGAIAWLKKQSKKK